MFDFCILQETPESSNSQMMNLPVEDIKAMLIEKYKNSEYSINTRKRIQQLRLINVSDLNFSKVNIVST